METLQLKHLAPYLPYGLRILYGDGRIKEIIGIRNWIGWCVTIKSEHGETNMGFGDVKPILRPLSEEIVKFFPHYGKQNLDYLKGQILTGMIDVVSFNNLVKNHYDVFNLIPQNLAIDINTINQKQ